MLSKKTVILIAGGLALALAACAPTPEPNRNPLKPEYSLRGTRDGDIQKLTLRGLEALGAKQIDSGYFDRAMNYQDSRFTAVPLVDVIRQFPYGQGADALILNCFDDYQGVLSLEDVRRFDLHLATRIHLAPNVVAPGWLNPLLILVPDGMEAPFQERFMTANIRELRFVKLQDYYAPLEAFVGDSPGVRRGLVLYQNNCLFCHSVAGVGGDKGGALETRFDFNDDKGRARFRDRFLETHQADNPDKQNVAQFIDDKNLDALGLFLQMVQER